MTERIVQHIEVYSSEVNTTRLTPLRNIKAFVILPV